MMSMSEEPAEPTAVALPTRIASRLEAWRAVFPGRVGEWLRAPWPAARVLQVSTTVTLLTVTTVIMMTVVHFQPWAPGRDLIFTRTTPTGGDFGAHVWGPAFLRDHLLPSGRLNGWSMDWYGGLPVYRFYMVLPALMILIADIVLPYGIAMKLVAVSGLITLPAACWAFGRLGLFRYPMPELMALAGVVFALDESFSIYGGNLKSTMAGEFSFSISLSIGIFGLGVLSAGMRTGRYRIWAAVLIAASAISHGIVAIFVLVAAAVIVMVWIDRTRLLYAVSVALTAMLLSIWWVGPFLLDHAYMTDMKYGFRPMGVNDSFWAMFFPLTAPLNMIISTFAVIGFVALVMRRHMTGTAVGVITLVLIALVYLTRDSLPVIGLLWNPRLLPFFYLMRYMLMMVGIVEIFTLIWNAIRDRRATALAGAWSSTLFAGVTTLGVLAVLGWTFQVLPGAGFHPHGETGTPVYAWGPLRATPTHSDALGDGWARYNFMGYEGRGEFYTEYHEIVTTMAELGEDPAHGCGRALWENSPDNSAYGTTMALMLLPHWTDGCIGSMEGLFFEASGTTPYHFLAAAAISKASSNPVRELRYENLNAEVGTRHLRDLGVRYAMVRSPEAKKAAATHGTQTGELVLVGASGPWEIYELRDFAVVTALRTQPVVVTSRSGDQRERHLELGTSWFQNPSEWAAVPADDGPPQWQRITAEVDMGRSRGEIGRSGRQVDVVVPGQQIEPVGLPEVRVHNVEIQQQSLSFSVDQVGVPVLVRVSYFPNWRAKGAQGPYRIAPNMMVVVPTATDVEMYFARSTTDWVFSFAGVAGIGLSIYWWRRGDELFVEP
jgi:hypothetical protein